MKKRCSACDKVKAISEFHKNTLSGDGYRSACAICVNAAQRARLQKRKRPKPVVIKEDQYKASDSLSFLNLVARKDTQPKGYYCR